MKRNVFGEPRPANSDEIGQAIDELHIDPSQAWVIVDEEEDNSLFAEVIGEDDRAFQAGPFESREVLNAALAANGIEHFE